MRVLRKALLVLIATFLTSVNLIAEPAENPLKKLLKRDTKTIGPVEEAHREIHLGPCMSYGSSKLYDTREPRSLISKSFIRDTPVLSPSEGFLAFVEIGDNNLLDKLSQVLDKVYSLQVYNIQNRSIKTLLKTQCDFKKMLKLKEFEHCVISKIEWLSDKQLRYTFDARSDKIVWHEISVD